VIELLEVSSRERLDISQLVSAGEKVAVDRHSSRLGVRHLLIAAGLPWRGVPRLRSVSEGVALTTGSPEEVEKK
jgi:hypothetical protein